MARAARGPSRRADARRPAAGASGARGLPKRGVVFAAHPEPDASSVRAARAARSRFFGGFGEGDVIVCLVSGGASSLLRLPRNGLTLAAKRRAVSALARVGRLDPRAQPPAHGALRGQGRPARPRDARAPRHARAVGRARRPRRASSGSGPTVRGRRGDLVRVVGSNRDGLDAAAREARGGACAVARAASAAVGRGADAPGARLARRGARGCAPGTVLLAGGETVVRLGRRARPRRAQPRARARAAPRSRSARTSRCSRRARTAATAPRRRRRVRAAALARARRRGPTRARAAAARHARLLPAAGTSSSRGRPARTSATGSSSAAPEVACRYFAAGVTT